MWVRVSALMLMIGFINAEGTSYLSRSCEGPVGGSIRRALENFISRLNQPDFQIPSDPKSHFRFRTIHVMNEANGSQSVSFAVEDAEGSQVGSALAQFLPDRQQIVLKRIDISDGNRRKGIGARILKYLFEVAPPGTKLEIPVPDLDDLLAKIYTDVSSEPEIQLKFAVSAQAARDFFDAEVLNKARASLGTPREIFWVRMLDRSGWTLDQIQLTESGNRVFATKPWALKR